MRTIKFRAWFKPTGKMFYDVQADSQDLTFDHYLYDGQRDRPQDSRFVVMQYIGFADRNGREIYEGDIVIRQDYEYPGQLREKLIETVRGVVVWSNYYSKFAIDVDYGNDNQDQSDYEYMRSGNTQLEVIGNIWATPELIPK